MDNVQIGSRAHHGVRPAILECASSLLGVRDFCRRIQIVARLNKQGLGSRGVVCHVKVVLLLGYAYKIPRRQDVHVRVVDVRVDF